jgi:hypothetical protein
MPNPENVIGKGRRWKKGESGNPKGRPKKIPDLHKALALVLGEEGKKDLNALEMILLSTRQEALKGNIRAAEMLLRYAFPNGLTQTTDSDMEVVWGKIGNENNEDTTGVS